MSKLRRSQNGNGGSSFYGDTITTTPQAIIDAYGAPDFRGEGDKVHWEWEFVNEEGNEVIIYDWKESSMPDLNSITTFNIGAHTGGESHRAAMELQSNIVQMR